MPAGAIHRDDMPAAEWSRAVRVASQADVSQWAHEQYVFETPSALLEELAVQRAARLTSAKQPLGPAKVRGCMAVPARTVISPSLGSQGAADRDSSQCWGVAGQAEASQAGHQKGNNWGCIVLIRACQGVASKGSRAAVDRGPRRHHRLCCRARRWA